jgi:hypothetical protein
MPGSLTASFGIEDVIRVDEKAGLRRGCGRRFFASSTSMSGIYQQMRGLREANPLESNGMDDLQVEIVRFVEECQPNIVEARFSDSEGRCHTFVDKSAIFTTDWSLDGATKYPQPGVIRCQVLARWQVPTGPDVVRVTTEIESTEGISEFVVLANQLSTSSSPAPATGQ